MNKTINISLPQKMLIAAKKLQQDRGYSSISEVIRDGLRQILYTQPESSGFTRKFENQVLKASEEPLENDQVWNTPEDVKSYFKDLKKQIK